MKTAFILAHDDPYVQTTFDIFRPLWEQLADDLVLLTPADRPLKIPQSVGGDKPAPYYRQVKTVLCGQSGYRGRSAVRRLVNQLYAVQAHGSDLNLIFEYDSVILPTRDARSFLHEFESGMRYDAAAICGQGLGYHWMHPPWILTYRAVERVLKPLLDLPENAYGGYVDQVWAHAAKKAELQVLDLGPIAMTKNTLTGADIPALLSAVNRGVCVFHGAKTGADEQLLDQLSHGPPRPLKER